MSLDRSGSLIPTDSDGVNPASGDPVNSTWVTLALDRVDGRWSELTITSTGTQNNLSITASSREADYLRCNNATLLSITGIVAPASPVKPGKRLIVQSVGAGGVQFLDQNGSSTAANRIITGISSTISQAAGKGITVLVYDDTDDRWRVVAHEQGDWLDYTPTWTASTTNPTLGNGTLNVKYYQRGKEVQFEFFLAIGSTTNIGSGTYTFTFPFTINGSQIGFFPGMVLDSGTTRYAALAVPSSTTTFTVGVHGSGTDVAHNSPMTWATGDQLRISGKLIL